MIIYYVLCIFYGLIWGCENIIIYLLPTFKIKRPIPPKTYGVKVDNGPKK